MGVVSKVWILPQKTGCEHTMFTEAYSKQGNTVLSYWYFGAKMAEEKKKKRKNYAKVITDFEHTVPSLRQKKSGTELDED